MEMPAQSGHDTDAVDAGVESMLLPSIHLSRRRNLIASPLLRLPTELVFEIFVHCFNYRHRHDRSLFVLTAICHQLREIGTASPQLWTSVDFATLPIAKLFLERCKYNPRTLLIEEPELRFRVADDPRREAVGRCWKVRSSTTFALSCLKGRNASSLISSLAFSKGHPIYQISTFTTFRMAPARSFHGPSVIPYPTSPPFASIIL